MAALGECVPGRRRPIPDAVARARRRARRRPRRRRPRGSARRGRRRRGRRRAGGSRSVRRAAAARLEGSKAWMKDVLGERRRADRRGTARSDAGDERAPRSRSSSSLSGPYVVKTDGLAAGKGVVVTESLADARDAVRAYLSGAAFGDAGRTLVIEEGLHGPEVSLFVLCDGRDADAARARAGPQARRSTATRGRTPAAWARTRRCRDRDAELVDEMMEKAIRPTLAELRRRDAEYPRRPVLRVDARSREGAARCSSTTCASATPSARFSCPGWRATSTCICREAASGRIETDVRARRRAPASVSRSRRRAIRPRRLAAATRSRGLDAAAAVDGVIVFHAGTKAGADGEHHDQRRPGAHGRRRRPRHRGGARPRVRGRGPDLVARAPLPSRHRSPGAPVIPRYSRPEIADLVHRRGALRRVARGRGARGRGLGPARRRPGRRRAR